MTDQELEQKLRTALEHAAPDDFQGVLARISPKARTEQAPIPFEAAARKKKRRWAPLAAAACLALIVAAGGGGWYLQNNTVASVVSLDVNPSVTLNVNAKETVLSAVPVNEDGGDILAGMDLTGVQLDVAMNAIVGALLTNGYVDELANSILITVEDDDAGRGARLQQELTDQADAILANTSVNGAILSQTIQNLIQTIVDNGNSLHTFEELVGLSINDLNLLYTSLITVPAEPSTGDGTSGSGTAAEPAPAIQSSGQASDSAYIGVEAAKSAAFAHAGLDASQVTMGEVDFDVRVRHRRQHRGGGEVLPGGGPDPDRLRRGERRGLGECFLRRGERDGPVRGRRHFRRYRQRGRPGRRPESRRGLPGSGLRPGGQTGVRRWPPGVRDRIQDRRLGVRVHHQRRRRRHSGLRAGRLRPAKKHP